MSASLYNQPHTYVMTQNVRLGKYIRPALLIGDFAIVNLSYLLVRMFVITSPEFDSRWMLFLANVAYLPCALLFSDNHKSRILYADRLMLNAFKSILLYGVLLVALMYMLGMTHVGLHCGIPFISLCFILLCLWWTLSYKILRKIRRMGLNFKRAIIVGAGDTAKQLLAKIQSDPGYGYRVMGVFDDNPTNRHDFHNFFTADTKRIHSFVRQNKIDIVFYTLDADNSPLMSKTMMTTDELAMEFIYVPRLQSRYHSHFTYTSIADIPVMKKALSPLTKNINKVLKRLFDIIFSSFILAISPIIFIPVAIGIKITSPGPIFFRQRRTGIYGKDFVCWKFRTMRVNDEADTLQATANDPRKTRFGEFLRKSSIDELPQFINVLRGNMSVVGPRPHMVSQTADYSRLIEKYMVRHSVKPGITGWAQVNGYRGSTRELWQMEKRVEHDVWYIQNWNFFLDIKIIVRTISNALGGERNAY